MKSTQHFTEAIKAYLDNRAAADAVFAEKYADEKKSVEECCTYILNEVKKSGNNAYAQEEIYGMAVHFYDEADIDAGDPVEGVRVVVPAPRGGNEETGDEATGDKRRGEKARGQQGKRRKGAKTAQVANLRQQKEPKEKKQIVELSLFD